MLARSASLRRGNVPASTSPWQVTRVPPPSRRTSGSRRARPAPRCNPRTRAAAQVRAARRLEEPSVGVLISAGAPRRHGRGRTACTLLAHKYVRSAVKHTGRER